jgi:hypothetical protein
MMAGPREPGWSIMAEDQDMSLAKLGGLLELLGFVVRLANHPPGEDATASDHSVSWPDGDYVVYAGPGETSAAQADLCIHRSRVFIRVGPDDRAARRYRFDRPELG